MIWQDLTLEGMIPTTICYNDIHGIQHSIIDQRIIPYRAELVDALNVVLFVDDCGNIESGQAGYFDYEEGLRVRYFTESGAV